MGPGHLGFAVITQPILPELGFGVAVDAILALSELGSREKAATVLPDGLKVLSEAP